MQPQLSTPQTPCVFHEFFAARLRVPRSDELREVIAEINAAQKRESRRPHVRMPIVFHKYRKAA